MPEEISGSHCRCKQVQSLRSKKRRTDRIRTAKSDRENVDANRRGFPNSVAGSQPPIIVCLCCWSQTQPKKVRFWHLFSTRPSLTKFPPYFPSVFLTSPDVETHLNFLNAFIELAYGLKPLFSLPSCRQSLIGSQRLFASVTGEGCSHWVNAGQQRPSIPQRRRHSNASHERARDIHARLRSFVLGSGDRRVAIHETSTNFSHLSRHQQLRNSSAAAALATKVDPRSPGGVGSSPGGQYGRKLNASEKEWLYEEELHSYADPEARRDVPPRFDWRKIVQRNAPPSSDLVNSYPYVKRKRTEACDGLASEYRDHIEAYEERFLPLIDAEEREEEKLIFDRLTHWPLERLKKEGYCLTGLHAFWTKKGNLGRPVAAFRFDIGASLPPHSFSTGTQVYISRKDPIKESPYKGSVIFSSPDQIGVAFEEEFEAESGLWRMDLGYSNAIFERMRDAIKKLPFDPAEFENDDRNSDKQEFMLHGTQLRDVLLKSFSPDARVAQHPHHFQDPADPNYPSAVLEHKSKFKESFVGAFSEDMRIRSWAMRYSRRDPVVLDGDPDLGKLNRSQIRAMATMIGERISLIQGPPGTGKTKTIVETVKLLKKEFGVVHPLLVCTYTNVAVDNLVEGLVGEGLQPVRVGFEGKAKPGFDEYLLEYQFDKHPLQGPFDKITQEMHRLSVSIRELMGQLSKVKEASTFSSKNMQERAANMQRDLDKMIERRLTLKIRRFVMEQRMYRDILSRADVICTTCIRSASYQLNAIDFPVVFLDEASMCTEPASLVPLMKGCRHLALIGDHKQLPPIVISNAAKDGGFDISLFERLTEEGDVPSIMLDTQYRMHPGISRFPSSEFYNLSLLDGTVNKAGQVQPTLLPPVSSHLAANSETGHRPSVIFIDHQGPEAVKSRSRVNWTEGYIACSVIVDLLINNPDLRGEDIGIIAPYKSQISLLTRLLAKDDDMREHLKEKLGVSRALEVANIEVKTVDGFEGREKEVIIFSTVRNNESGYIGFLADRRRLNVGLTRAKRALFVLGSMSTLENGKFGRASSERQMGEESTKASKGAVAWRNYAKFLSEQKLIVPLRGDNLQNVLKPLRSKRPLTY